jgi:uncharacterized protein YhhL (DUF1145 family)
MSEIIFKRVIDKINDATANINNYFDNFSIYNANFYEILKNLPKQNIIIYLFLALIIFNLIRPFNIRLNEILTFMVCILVIYYLIQKDYSEFTTYIKSKKNQLNFLHKLMFNDKGWSFQIENEISFQPSILKKKSYLYMNPIIVELFYNARKYLEYNPNAYISSIRHCNNVIGFDYETKIGLNREYYNYDTAVLESKKALNDFQSFIYSIDPLTLQNFPEFLDYQTKLHELLNAHLYNMSILFKQKNKTDDLTVNQRPDNFYDMNFYISPDNTKTRDYNSVFDMY